jgi:uncharacterized protein YndB with AHSA1/START domain
MIEPRGKKQLERSISSPASAGTIWAILTDSTKLAHWAPPVGSVESCDIDGEKIGSERVCTASLAGRLGTMVERVIDMKEMSHITYAIIEDSFGMSKMFADYAFRLSLAPNGRATRIKIESFYTPRNPLYTLMNRCMMKRQFSRVLDGLLAGLSSYAVAQQSRRLTTSQQPMPR